MTKPNQNEIKDAFLRAIRNQNIDGVNSFLSQENIDVNQSITDNMQGRSFLHYVAGMEDSEFDLFVISELLKKGAKPNQVEVQNEWTPLHEAAASGHINTVKLLLKHQADIHAIDLNDNTPLMLAAIECHCAVIQTILESKPNETQRLINVINLEGENAINLAAKTFYDENSFHSDDLEEEDENNPVFILEKYGAIFSPLGNIDVFNHAIKTDNQKRIDAYFLQLDRNEININQLSSYDDSILSAAIYASNIPLIQRLLEEYNPNLQLIEAGNHNCLMLAAYTGNVEVLTMLTQNQTAEQINVLLNQINDDGDNAITIAFENGYDDMVAALQEFGAILPAHLQNTVQAAEVVQLNQNQSTHEVSIHESVSCSMLALASEYLPNLHKDERKVLNAWFQAELSDSKRITYRDTAKEVLSKLLKHDDVKTYITENISKLFKFLTNLNESDCAFEEHNTLKVKSAKQAIHRILTNKSYKKHIDSRSGTPMILGLALVWSAAHDNKTIIGKLSNKERSEILVQAFYEMQRGNNLDHDGHEINPDHPDQPICVSGHFNKLLNALSGGRHPKVNLILITKETIIMRLHALIQEQYITQVPLSMQLHYFKEIEETNILPPTLWNDYLKNPTLMELKKEYQSFIDAKMINDNILNKAIVKTVNSILPSYVISKILKPLSFRQTLDEAKQTEIIYRYDLAKTESGKNNENSHMSELKKRAIKYNLDIPNGFRYDQYLCALNPSFRNMVKNQREKFKKELTRKTDISLISLKRKRKEDKQIAPIKTIFLYPSYFQAGIDIELINQLNQVIGLGVKLKIIASDIPSFENIYFVIKKYCEEKSITCPKMESQFSSSSRDITISDKNRLKDFLAERHHSYSKPHL